MFQNEFDLAIVGAGIIGLSHAYLAAKAGLRVVVFERDPFANKASLRNFGMVWPIGLPPGHLHQTALRSRELWLELLTEAALHYQATGSLHAAYRDDEAAVATEFAAKAVDYNCTWLDAGEACAKSAALNPEGLLGALWSPVELTVDPRLIVSKLPSFLSERFGVEFHFDTAVQEIAVPTVRSGQKTWRAKAVILATGDDFQTLFPEALENLGLTRCKLQMMRTVVQPAGWQLGPSLAFGLTFRHYSSFKICQSLPALADRIARETPEFDQWGIHVMVSAGADCTLTLGDSHQYGLGVDIFDRSEIDALILNYARQYVRLPHFDIAQSWHGVYAKHSEMPYLRYSPQPKVHGLIVTSGIGMTLSFGLAEQTLREMGVAA